MRAKLQRAGLPLAALCLIASAVAGAAFAAPAQEGSDTSSEPAFRHVLTREGIEVEVTLDPLFAPGGELVEGDSVNVRFAVRDTHTGQPLPSLYPAGWLDRLAADEEMTAEQCRSKVSSFIGGGFLSRAELDLNAYYVLSLNDEPSVSVVDPLFSFGGKK